MERKPLVFVRKHREREVVNDPETSVARFALNVRSDKERRYVLSWKLPEEKRR